MGRRLIDVLLQLLFEFGQVRPAGAQDLAHLGRIENRKQQMLDGKVFMTRFARAMKCIVETVFQFVRQHD